MRYRAGDLVYPADLPQRVLCRVVAARNVTVDGAVGQVLKLEPLEGQPWHPAVSFIRRDPGVLPVRIGDLWRAGMPIRPAPQPRHGPRAA